MFGVLQCLKLGRQTQSLKFLLEAAYKKIIELKGHQNPRSSDKDGGVDIIGWKSFNDNRSNKVVLLIQCGAGKHFGKRSQSILKNGNAGFTLHLNPQQE